MLEQTSSVYAPHSFDVVLVNYKTHDLTSNALRLLQNALHGRDGKVWVVDNDSADSSTEYLRSLDWIELIERKPKKGEPGFMAHGEALDLVLEKSQSKYLLLMHTDTMIYDPKVFDLLLAQLIGHDLRAAAGCVDQLYRGEIRIAWRFFTRFAKYHYRSFKRLLGLPSRTPKPYREIYLKSFCAMWNAALLRERGFSFAMKERIPGYEAQDRLLAAGYSLAYIPARTLFRYLDHVEAGTVSAIGGYGQDHRRLRKYQAMLKKLDTR